MTSDLHSATALKLFGEVTPDTRSKAKIINYMEMYGSGQIRLGKKAGQFPVNT